MQNPNPPRLIQNLLILVTVIGFAFTGWLAGHILRHSIPEYQFRHPPIPEITPKIKNGYESEFEGIRRMVVLSENSAVYVFANEGTIYLEQVILDQCHGNTYYTSLPAKCRSVDGRLVQAGGPQLEQLLIPWGK